MMFLTEKICCATVVAKISYCFYETFDRRENLRNEIFKAYILWIWTLNVNQINKFLNSLILPQPRIMG